MELPFSVSKTIRFSNFENYFSSLKLDDSELIEKVKECWHLAEEYETNKFKVFIPATHNGKPYCYTSVIPLMGYQVYIQKHKFEKNEVQIQITVDTMMPAARFACVLCEKSESCILIDRFFALPNQMVPKHIAVLNAVGGTVEEWSESFNFWNSHIIIAPRA